ncbi:MAG: tRNA (adenosine(37)-N6)-threonylcarbamoyltransferase complex transferase subunit TsaD [Patescibacteria group bacterium]|nr:tRNA (adenosine(37)-N6)-threonylcarbamoyltransferase complex transferase subunit TsaD [Patescibacteria group bacterium]
MRILSIETSCDETAVSVLDCDGPLEKASFTVLGNALFSQADLHAPYGGVYPALAKREHQGNLVPLTRKALSDASLLSQEARLVDSAVLAGMREEAFRTETKNFLESYATPKIDLVAVTKGPGLEPALWTGINFAEALGKTWNTPVFGIDHMEGHIVSGLLEEIIQEKKFSISNFRFPLLALLISGGHTELVLMKEWFVYENIGRTKDDAVGEAFDKVARLLELPYPGGPKIEEAAARSRERVADAGGELDIRFPRPLLNDGSYDFSFSGLKTAVLYKLRAMDEISERDKEEIAHAFEDAARDVLVEKTSRAVQDLKPGAVVVGGGVSANREIRQALENMLRTASSETKLLLPPTVLTGDNAIMIGAAAYLRFLAGKKGDANLSALGNVRLEESNA